MTAHVKPKALENFKARDFQMLIDGVWVNGDSTIERIAPGHGRGHRVSHLLDRQPKAPDLRAIELGGTSRFVR